MKKLFLIFGFLLGMISLVSSQGFVHTQGKIIVDGNNDTLLMRAMGLGGWMLQEGYMIKTASFASPQHKIREKIEQLIGAADTDLFYDAWLANHVRKIDIDSLASWGFNTVRLPMHYNLFTLPIEDEPVLGQQTWLTKGFELTDSLISWCKQNNMYVILDLHGAPGGQGKDAAISDYDETKPALWESVHNRDKMVALWKRIANRYKDETAIAGYDLLNEPNWQMTNNGPLKALYLEVTDSIRAVDTNHMILIEGNWFANDFTNLTPPWDNNMVYSPHKYWSHNEVANIQWVLPMRDNYNVPLFFGESGENSNTWFRDAIKLFEDHNIGWAWWPMKKVDDIAGPLSINRSSGYQTLLNYWENGGTQPTAAFAKAVLMQFADDLKIENCFYQKDVIDAMFRQVQSDETVPYRHHTIPGPVYASDFDMGVANEAYKDTEVANYHLSTGNYTAWNSGWQYRNDGVDLEVCTDNVFTTGYNMGFLDAGEWTQYTTTVMADAVYDIDVRVAANAGSGKFHFSMDGATITPVTSVPNTGGWQTWQTVTIPNVILGTNDKKLRLNINNSGFNISSFNFIQKGATTSLATAFVSAKTIDNNNIQLVLNKPLTGPLPSSPADFLIYSNGNSIPITNVELSTDNKRIINFTVNHVIEFDQVLKISYTGNQINATDGTALTAFTLEDVENTLALIHNIPGRIEAEDYFHQVGTQKEFTSDLNGVYNLGYLDVDDYMDYNVDIQTATTYDLSFRTASQSDMGELEMQLIDGSGNVTVLKNITFSPTGNWQTWATTNTTVTMPTTGRQHLRLVVKQAPFNFNWFELTNVTNTNEVKSIENIQVFPNPSQGLFNVRADMTMTQNVTIEVYNTIGQNLWNKTIENTTNLQETLDLSSYPNGNYFIIIKAASGKVYTQNIIKME